MSNQRASSPVSSSCSSSCSSSSSTPQWKYDVFLSFRGEDTRNEFTDHLYAALEQRGIVVFRDDEKLERGKAIAPELLKAIAESRFSIVVFSRNYASSRWCLDELVEIVECMWRKGQVVLPVFYHVDPSEVRKQIGSFQEAFAKHEEDFRENIKKVQEWRTAMTEVANLSGWHLQDRPEAKVIQDIVKKIWCTLNPTLPSIADSLVGIKFHVEELNAHLGEGLSDVRFIGICGMGGIGKTTIASVVYQQLSHQFESSCFLVNVKEVFQNLGLLTLQNQLLSEVLMEPNINVSDIYTGVKIIMNRLRCKKVLIILDDVDELKQLDMLAKDRGWFGPGSRIIITTRDEHLLKAHEVDWTYKVKQLNYAESLELFSWKAFKQNHPAEGYEERSWQVVDYANGLPLALEVLGSLLYGRNEDSWKGALDRLKKYPNKQIHDILQVSYDGLEEVEKKIFLDIACFFKGSDRNYVTKILDACGFNPGIGIEVLIDKSLIKMSENILWMHDLLQEMGREIVRRECTEEPGKRSRLWAYEDVNHVLTENTGTDAVETMVIDLPKPIEAQWKADSFSKMSKLRLLKIHNVHPCQGPKCLSNELRFLKWHGYPSKCMPSSFHPNELVELHMRHSQNLTKTPDFTRIPNLERLILKGCTKLCEVHTSIGLLKKLIFLNLKDCKSLKSLPSNIEMESLQKFILSGCSKLRKFPKNIGKMELLSELYLDGTAIEELPSSIEHLGGLVLLNLRGCKNFLSLPSNINGLKSLKTLNLSGCPKLKNVPVNLGQVKCLEVLDVSETAIRQIPSAIFLLKNLKELSFRGCKGPPSKLWHSQFPFLLMQRKSVKPMPLMLPSLSGFCSLAKLDLSDCNLGEGAIPNNFGCLSSLTVLHLSNNNFVSLPASISQLSQLLELDVDNCKSLQSLPMLPSNLAYLHASACTSLEMLPDPTIQWNTETRLDSDLSLVYLFSCFKLVENHGCSSLATKLMKTYLQQEVSNRSGYCFSQTEEVSNRGGNFQIRIPETPDCFSQTEVGIFEILIPGNEIPDWFSYQAEISDDDDDDDDLAIQWYPHLHTSSKLRGFALCYNFVAHQHPPVLHSGPANPFNLHLTLDDVPECREYMISSLSFKKTWGQAVPDHLHLIFTPLDDMLRKASGIRFSIQHNKPGFKVKKIGLCPVYELSQTMNECSSPTFENFKDLFQDFDESTRDGTLIIRIYEEGGPSGSDCFDDER